MYQIRKAMLGAEEEFGSTILWDAVDRGLRLSTAYNIYLNAKKEERVSGASAKILVEKELVERAQAKAEGRQFRRKKLPDEVSDDGVLGTRELKWAVSEAASKWMRGKEVGIGRQEADRLLKELRSDLFSDIFLVQRRLGRILGIEREQRQSEMRSKVREACLLLDVPSPRNGNPIDEKRAQRRYHEVAHNTHPDCSGGSVLESSLMTFRAAKEAMCVIREYNADLGDPQKENAR